MNIVRAVAQMRALHKCSHEFDFIKRKPDRKGVVGYCPKCRGKFHAWPGTIYYQEILAAEERHAAMWKARKAHAAKKLERGG